MFIIHNIEGIFRRQNGILSQLQKNRNCYRLTLKMIVQKLTSKNRLDLLSKYHVIYMCLYRKRSKMEIV